MKLRKQIRHLFEALKHEIWNSLSEGHDHQPFILVGTGCMLCRLLENIRHPFAILQLAREQGLARDWMPAEHELYNLIGEKAFKNKMLRDVEFVKNMPKKTCQYCGGKVTLFMTIKELAYLMLSSKSPVYTYPCTECGRKITIAKTDIPPALSKLVHRRLAAIRRKRKLRMKKLDLPDLSEIINNHIQHNPPVPGNLNFNPTPSHDPDHG